MSRSNGTPGDVYASIWKSVKRIPRGKVSTYGSIARMSGIPGHARQVGYALHNLPLGADIPWHRVINSQGRISLPTHNGKYQKQQVLLEAEGIPFMNNKVSLTLYGWKTHLLNRTR